jgi:hypothetical protein
MCCSDEQSVCLMLLAADGKRQADLQLRVVEHNVMVVARYYTRISFQRLSQLLDLSPEEVSGGRAGAGASGSWL